MSQTLAFITYESPFAPCGGLAAVMKRLPVHIQKVSNFRTIAITPYHHRIEGVRALPVDYENNITVRCDGQPISVNIYKYKQHQDEIDWYLIRPHEDNEWFFAGQHHPYDVGATLRQKQQRLVEDALFFGAAVGKSLDVIVPNTECILMLNEWEAATTVLALTQHQQYMYKIFLILHNIYDSGEVTKSDLEAVDIDPNHSPGPEHAAAPTVLERICSKIEHPIITVSRQFKEDITQDVFHTNITFKHLQHNLRNKLHGINHGVFTDLSVDTDMLSRAKRNEFGPIKNWKNERNKSVCEHLLQLQPTYENPIWGSPVDFASNNSPLLVMAGRDEPNQKGYDVAALATRMFLSREKGVRFLFMPMPSDVGRQSLRFLKIFAEEYPKNVLVLPFKLPKDDYTLILQSAIYGILPSLYEPFGMANEFYLNGALCIGRATGGTLQQVVPLEDDILLSLSARQKAKKLHYNMSSATGILYRERDEVSGAVRFWEQINRTGYLASEDNMNRLKERERIELIRDMAQQLYHSIRVGINLYQNHPNEYYQMVVNGIDYVLDNFNWENAAKEYRDLVSR